MRSLFFSITVVAMMLSWVPSPAQAQTPFGYGNLVVYRKGDGVGTLGNTATQINVIELSSTSLAQPTPIQTVNVSTALNLFTSGTATSTGYLKMNPNGNLTLTGHVGTGAGNINTNVNRAVALVNVPTGSVSVGTTYTGISGNQTRSAVSQTGADFYIIDQGGIYQNGGAAPALAGNFRAGQIINNQSYVSQTSASATTIVVSATNPALPGGAAPTVAGLPGLTNNNTAQDFILLSSTGDGGPTDLLYVSTTTGIAKFSFDGANWNAQGTAAVAGGLFGITARVGAAGGFDLFFTTGSGATVANNVDFANDSAAFNAPISLGSLNVLYTAPANTTLAGLAIAVPEPTTYALLGMTAIVGVAVWFIRRRQQMDRFARVG